MAALLSPSTLPGEINALYLLAARMALAQIRVDTLIGSQANYKIKITIYFYKIISYEKYSTLNLKNTKISKHSNLQLFIN